MNFFQAQDRARKNTSRLIILFSFAVIALVILTNLLFIGALSYMEITETVPFAVVFQKNFQQDTILVISIGVSFLILLGSLYKTISLSKGGRAIAELLGGQLVPQSTSNTTEKQLLNVVEEMAIAAGMPIPTVYLLEEKSINAFAAGQSHNTAVIGVTRGTIEQLSRDELQGVIAHEFSHILNGDMKLNLRLMGILHGILLIGIVGEHIFNSIRYGSSRSSRKGGAPIIFIGLGLMIIGYTGTFFGRWIKASVSRQREFLADASAVQFTRNKNSISGALKKIGGLSDSSILYTPAASEYSHAYFANGVRSLVRSLFATHPPLEQRIRSIEPNWNGLYTKPKKSVSDQKTSEVQTKDTFTSAIVGAAILSATDNIVNQIGNLSEESILKAQQIVAELPIHLHDTAKNAYSARAILYAILINRQINQEQCWILLKEHADNGVDQLSKELYPSVSQLKDHLILPLIEVCVNSLRELSLKQYSMFKKTTHIIITHDKSIDLNEWMLQHLVFLQLDEYFALKKPAKAKYALLGEVKKAAETLLSLVAYVENDDINNASHSFQQGIKEIGATAFNIVKKESFNVNDLNEAVAELKQLKPILKQRILKAIAIIILEDNNKTQKGIELFRTVSISLDCPAPLL